MQGGVHPRQSTVEATLDIGDQTKTSADATLIRLWQDKVPKHPPVSLLCLVEKSTNADTRPLIIEFVSTTTSLIPVKPDFFPDASDQFEVQGATEELSGLSLRKLIKKYSGDWPKEISGVIVVEVNGQRQGYQVKLPIAEIVQPVKPRVGQASRLSLTYPAKKWRQGIPESHPYYYQNAAWIWRGLTEHARCLERAGREHQDDALQMGRPEH